MADKASTISFIDAIRKNRSGAVLSGLIVMIAVALVLSAAVPDDLNTLIVLLLILVIAGAVGFTVRVTSPRADGPTLLTAGGLAGIGVPLLFEAGSKGAFDDAIQIALFNPWEYLTIASALGAIIAIIIVAWGARTK